MLSPQWEAALFLLFFPGTWQEFCEFFLKCFFPADFGIGFKQNIHGWSVLERAMKAGKRFYLETPWTIR